MIPETRPGTRASVAAGVAGVLGATLVAHSAVAVTAVAPIRRALFKQLSGVSSSPALALTFDDGPDLKSTPMFLDQLDEFGWKATFFMLGSMAAKAPSLTKEVQARGHEIALHGFLHKNLLFRSPKSTREDIRKGLETLSDICGSPISFYRPPYGVFNTQALITAKDLELTPILWSAWGRDWRAQATPESVVRDLSKGLGPGNTLLLHDSDCTSAAESYRSTLGALNLLEKELQARALLVERLCDHFYA